MDDFKIAHRPQITSLGEMSVHPLSPSLPSFFLIRKRKKKGKKQPMGVFLYLLLTNASCVKMTHWCEGEASMV